MKSAGIRIVQEMARIAIARKTAVLVNILVSYFGWVVQLRTTSKGFPKWQKSVLLQLSLFYIVELCLQLKIDIDLPFW